MPKKQFGVFILNFTHSFLISFQLVIWIILLGTDCIAGRVLNMTTLSDYSYQQLWFTTMSTESAVLRIMACRDAHIVLSETIGMGNNLYEIGLGIIGNTVSVIREGLQGVNIERVETPNILNCNELRFVLLRSTTSGNCNNKYLFHNRLQTFLPNKSLLH